MFKPKINELVLTDGDESQTFYIRGASLKEQLEAADQANSKESKVQSTKRLLSRFLVNADGSAVSKEFIEDVMSMDALMSDQLSEAILARVVPKKDDEKNV
jgi:hypothetical protein